MPDAEFRLHIGINAESHTVTLTFEDIPLESLGRLLWDMRDPKWQQQIIDSISAAEAGFDLGIDSTTREFITSLDDEAVEHAKEYVKKLGFTVEEEDAD